MSTTAKATGFLELNITGFEGALKTAKNLMATFAAGFTAYKIERFFQDGIKEAINFGREINSAGRAMGGFDPGNLLLVQKALENSGQGAEEARGHISDFIKEGRHLSQLFIGADSFTKGLAQATKDYGQEAKILSAHAEDLQKVWNMMAAVSEKVRTFFLALTSQFVKPLNYALDMLNQIDLSGIGTAFGKAIGDSATTLVGIFQNGDLYEFVKVGLTYAFQESINYLVGGYNWINNNLIPTVGELLGEAFVAACDILGKTLSFIFSGEFLKYLAYAFTGIATSFTASIISGMAKAATFLGAAMGYAHQSVLENIPGLKDVIGKHQSFKEIYKQSEDILGTGKGGTLNDVLENGPKEFYKGAGGILKKFTDGLTEKHPGAGFQKANVFNTSERADKLSHIIENGFKQGGVEIEKIWPKDLTSGAHEFGGGGARGGVIADRLAKVGGGGGYLITAQSIEQQNLNVNRLALRANEEVRDQTKKIEENTRKLAKEPNMK